jgi:pSer/pThr/pTyr-binding forkhead associated (FHA) protein
LPVCFRPGDIAGNSARGPAIPIRINVPRIQTYRFIEVGEWLVRTSGPLAGTRYPIRNSVTFVGRSPQNDILIEDDARVSLTHLRIDKEGDSYELHDLDSTNGTYVNGVLTKDAVLEAPCSIQLGLAGPQLSFVLDHSLPFEPDQTIETSGDGEVLKRC